MNASATRTLVENHLPLIRSIAGKVLRSHRAPVEIDDLISVGVVGLIEARGRFDENAGASFSTFAYYRIRGAMLDAIAATGPVPRGAYRGGRAPFVTSLEAVGGQEQVPDAGARTVEQDIDLHHTTRRLRRAVGTLPPRQRELVRRHYNGGEALQDIGRDLGVSKSWASRLHHRALGTLRGALAAA